MSFVMVLLMGVEFVSRETLSRNSASLQKRSLRTAHTQPASFYSPSTAVMSAPAAKPDEKKEEGEKFINIGGEGTLQNQAKLSGTADIGDDLANAAPRRDKDLHPSKTYAGDGDEVAEDEWSD